MKCPNCGFITFKSSNKCASCKTKLGKAGRRGVPAHQGAQDFSIFAAPVPPIDIESIADEMNDIFTKPDTAGIAEGGDDAIVPVMENFDLDLAEMNAEMIAETGESGTEEHRAPSAEMDDQDGADALVVDLDGEEEPSEFEIEGMGFECSEEEDQIPAEATEAAPTDEIEIGLEPEEVTDELEVSLEPEEVTDDIEVSLEPEEVTDDIEVSLEPEEATDDLEVSLEPEEVAGDVEVDFDPELATEPEADAQTESPPAEVTGDVEFNFEAELEVEPEADAQPESPLAEVTGDVEFNFEAELEVEPEEEKPAAVPDEPVGDPDPNDDIELDLPDLDLSEPDDEDGSLGLGLDPDEDKH